MQHQSLEKRDLFLNVVDIVIFSIEIDDLERDDVGSRNVSAFIYRAIGTFADDFQALPASVSVDASMRMARAHLKQLGRRRFLGRRRVDSGQEPGLPL